MNKLMQELLFILDEAGDGLWEFIITPPGKLRLNRVPRSTIYHALDRLEKHHLIRKKKYGRQNHYLLTEEARKLLKRPITKKLRSDGLSTVIAFDIPQNKSKARDILRRYLQRNGYTILQKSVLISPFEISDDLRRLINELKIRKNISVLESRVRYDL